MLPDIFSFSYFVVVDNSDDCSPFCGFGYNLLQAKRELRKILKCPKNIVELGKNRKHKFEERLRVATSHCIFPIKYTSFCRSFFDFPCLFPVIVYDKSKFADIPNVIAKFKNVPFLIELNDNVSDSEFIHFFYNRICNFQKSNSNEVPMELISNLVKNVEKESSVENIYKKISLHGTVDFLINVFEDNGFKFINSKPFVPSLNQDRYYKNIELVNAFVRQFIASKSKNNRIDCIYISSPLFTRYLLKNDFAKISDPNVNKALKKIISQVGYIYSLNTEENEINYLLPALRMRQMEIEIYYICLYLIFERNFCPIIRLPQGVQTDVQQEIDGLRTAKDDKIGKAFLSLMHKVEIYFKNFTCFLPSYKKIPTVKIYSDGPVEFVRDKKNNLPIAISTSLCKIPSAPGNIFFNSVANDFDLFIHYKELFEILIIRSFNDSDPNKNILRNSIEEFFEGTTIQHIHYIFEDVADCESVVSVLKKYPKVKIVVFDCHGQQSKNDTFGNLLIGNEKFNIWEYVAKSEYFQIPPIVLFSACNTFPLGNTFNSIANGFLAAGVKTVIATNSPVDSYESAIFITRILYRIDELLPKLFTLYKTITWLDFISDFFRMSFVTDITKYFIEHKLISDEKCIQIRIDENFRINEKSVEWYQAFLHSLAEASGKTKQECEHIITVDIGFTETMKYIVLGNADSIIIHGE